MNYKILLIFLLSIFLIGCEQVAMKPDKIETKIEKKYSNSGFALIFDENVKKIKKLDDRSLMIHHKSLKRKSAVKITNPKNGKSLIAEVKSNNQKFSDFYNSVISRRIAEDLDLDFNESKTKKKEKKTTKEKFSYSIKIADFYYKSTAKMMISRIKDETSIKNSRIKKLSQTKFRVLIGPFNDIKSLKESFEKLKSLNFENLEVLKNV